MAMLVCNLDLWATKSLLLECNVKALNFVHPGRIPSAVGVAVVVVVVVVVAALLHFLAGKNFCTNLKYFPSFYDVY